MNKNPLVSVIITTYNREKLLSETIQSILNQTYKNFEIIVIDNYSNYDLLLLIKKFNSSNIYFFQNHNNGCISVNRNFGMTISNGEYISFCDDDDIWSPTKLEEELNVFKKYPNITLVSTNYFSLTKDGVVITDNYFKKLKYQIVQLFNNPATLLCCLNYIITSSVIIKKSNHLFDIDSSIIGSEDFDFWLKLSFNSNFKFINKKLVYYRVHEDNIYFKNRAVYVKKFLFLILKYWDHFNIKQKFFFQIRYLIFSVFKK